MQQSLSELIKANQLERLDTNLYRGYAQHRDLPRIYGGQLLAQAVYAVSNSVSDEFAIHSLHGYFLRPGDTAKGIIFAVEPLRDGRSYVTRHVVAKQNGQVIFNCSFSLQKPEPGLDYQVPMPEVIGPEGLLSDEQRTRQIGPGGSYGWPVEYRQVDPMDFHNPEPKKPISYTWLKASGAVVDDPNIHQQLLAYASDNPILVTALRPHGLTYQNDEVIMGSLDHALWFHRPFRIDEWLLFESVSDSTSGGRALSRGKIFDQRGNLVASVVQEGFVRIKGR